jgi:DGQHR domain-containing protein
MSRPGRRSVDVVDRIGAHPKAAGWDIVHEHYGTLDMTAQSSVQAISVIVPANPFAPPGLSKVKHCLAALDVEKLMEWWPGTPHAPDCKADKVRAIQRSLDWKRVAQIAAYLLQREIKDTPDCLNKYFRPIYEPRKLEKGREWPPRVPQVIGYERSQYPTFSNVLLHVNGAQVKPINGKSKHGAAELTFDEQDPQLNFSVIDGQHRINGAFFAVRLLSEERKGNDKVKWEIPAEIFLDLDAPDDPPRHQAQIFIDVNFYQKKVDRSLVADLFPTARGPRGPLDDKERAQDIGRKLMLEVGPLVGMIQIPGIKFGVRDVVSLATLNSAIEGVLGYLEDADLKSLNDQASFLAQCLDAWLESTQRRAELQDDSKLDPENVAYQGRVVVSFLALVPACLWKLKKSRSALVSDKARTLLADWLRDVMDRAGLLTKAGQFLAKRDFKDKGYLGSGGIGRFRNTLWAAALGSDKISRLGDDKKAKLAEEHRTTVERALRGPE